MQRVREYFEELGINDIANSDQAINRIFTNSTAFEEFVRASEGVARDAINIIGNAAITADDRKISVSDVRRAARTWYTRDKEKAVAAKPKALRFMRWIIDTVIGKRNARAFLFESNKRNEYIDYLVDQRVLHIIKQDVSSKDKPGVRYTVYSIDYGCYVDLINTAKAPKGLFEAISDEGESPEYVNVPQDDYRSIRRAILVPEDFEKLELE